MTIDCQTQSEYTVPLLMSSTDKCLSQTLMRDGYRCAITGRYNATSVENGVPVAGNVLAMSQAQVAHIFPPSTNLGTGEQEGDKVHSTMYLLVDLQFISLACSVTMRRGCGQPWNISGGSTVS